MSPELQEFFGNEPSQPDWSDRDAVINYLVEVERPFAAHSRAFDLEGMRTTAARLVDHAGNIAAQLTNAFMIDAGQPWRDRLSTITVPTLVMHGTEDPMFPIGHGQALAAEIPNAQFIPLPQTGHELFPHHTWPTAIPAILTHTTTP
jgi:pimeloyl-ACP methyl ester carboxylesterase